MNQIILNKNQVYQLISENYYSINQKTDFVNGCLDDCFKKEEIPDLLVPGGELGEISLILATANVYGFEVDRNRLIKTILNFSKEKNKIKISHYCNYWLDLQKNPQLYHLSNEEILFISSFLEISSIKKTNNLSRSAVLMIRGDFSVYSEYDLEIEEKKQRVSVFVYHQILVDQKHRLLAKKLIENKAVKLYPGCDDEYLYQVISEEGENHLFEILKKIGKGLPIFEVKFDKEGKFEIEELEKII